MKCLRFDGYTVTTSEPHTILKDCELYGTNFESSIDSQLGKLLNLMGCTHLDVIVDTNVSPWLTVWKLWGVSEQIGQIEARFGSIYSDEPDGFSAYLIGHNWTDVCPTVELCYTQHLERENRNEA